MRLIDVDAISTSDMLIAIADYVGDTKKKTVMCRRAVQGIQRLLEVQPTIDQWHYPSKGELPTDNRRVLCIVDGEPYIAEYHSVSGNWYSDKMSCSSAFVECWKEIVPPKEEA